MATGSVGASLNDVIKLADPKNPSAAVAYYTSRVIANFMSKYPNFRYHGNRAGRTSLHDPIKLADPRTPSFVQERWTYLPHRSIYSQFSEQKVKFSLPWQRESVTNLNDTMKLADSENPQFG